MLVTTQLVVDGPADQQEAGRNLHGAFVDESTGREKGRGHRSDRQGVAQSDRGQRLQDGGATLAMQAERDREQPAHGRVQPMECAQPDQRQPGPSLGHLEGFRLRLSR
jgi:hypothetical protein